MKLVRLNSSVITSGARQSRLFGVRLDCRVAALLAMTGSGLGSGLPRFTRNDGGVK